MSRFYTRHSLTRRAAVSGMFLTVVFAARSQAGEGGGARDAVTPGNDSNSQTKTVTEFLSQDAFIRMSPNAMQRSVAKATKEGKDLVVEGFTRGMTTPLIEMMQADPRSTRRLIRDMRGLTTRKERRARLSKEIKEQARRMKVYQDSVKQAEGSTDSTTRDIADEDRIRWANAQTIWIHLRKWRRDPFEGTY